MDLAKWALRTSPKFTSFIRVFDQIRDPKMPITLRPHACIYYTVYIYIYIYIQGVKNNVYYVSGMIEEVKTNIFYLTKLWLMHRFAARWSYG